jgi:GNAT superfamily N-acetyltransferase
MNKEFGIEILFLQRRTEALHKLERASRQNLFGESDLILLLYAAYIDGVLSYAGYVNLAVRPHLEKIKEKEKNLSETKKISLDSLSNFSGSNIEPWKAGREFRILKKIRDDESVVKSLTKFIRKPVEEKIKELSPESDYPECIEKIVNARHSLMHPHIHYIDNGERHIMNEAQEKNFYLPKSIKELEDLVDQADKFIDTLLTKVLLDKNDTHLIPFKYLLARGSYRGENNDTEERYKGTRQFVHANSSDIDAIVNMLHDDVLGENRESISDKARAAYNKAFDDIIDDYNQYLMVVKESENVIATCHLTLMPSLTFQGSLRMNIEAVRVKKDKRGQGIGTWMFDKVIQFAKEKDVKILQLATNLERKSTLNFYKSLNFIDSHAGMKLTLS